MDIEQLVNAVWSPPKPDWPLVASCSARATPNKLRSAGHARPGSHRRLRARLQQRRTDVSPTPPQFPRAWLTWSLPRGHHVELARRAGGIHAGDRSNDIGEGLGNCFPACVASILELLMMFRFRADEQGGHGFFEWLEAQTPLRRRSQASCRPCARRLSYPQRQIPRGRISCIPVVAKGEDIVDPYHGQTSKIASIASSPVPMDGRP